MADYISGMWGAIGVLLALRHVQQGGAGQFVDVALYESVFRLLDEIAPAYAKFGTVRDRMGPIRSTSCRTAITGRRTGTGSRLPAPTTACSSDWRR